MPYENHWQLQPRSRRWTPREELGPTPRVTSPVFVHPPPGWVVHQIQNPQLRSLDRSTWGKLHFGAGPWSELLEDDPIFGGRAAMTLLGPPDELRVVLSRGDSAPVTGQVVSTTRAGVAGNLVLLEHERHGRAWARTDARGKFVTPAALPFGTWRANIYPGHHLERGAHHAQFVHEAGKAVRLVIDAGPSFTLQVTGAAHDPSSLRARCVVLGDEARVGSWLPLTSLGGERYRLSYPFPEFASQGPWFLQVATAEGRVVGRAPIGPESADTRIELAQRPALTLDITDDAGEHAACAVTLHPLELGPADPFALGLPSLVGSGPTPSLLPEQVGRWEVRIDPHSGRLAPTKLILELNPNEARTETIVLEPAED